jgi:ABC-type sugar transport system substrate-binding protein
VFRAHFEINLAQISSLRQRVFRITLTARMKIGSPLNPMLTMLALVALGLSPAFAETKNDSFELAMVIKETTNPYYNATLAGARIAAGEIGGTANNYGPTQASGQAQVDLINNLADQHVPIELTRSRH